MADAIGTKICTGCKVEKPRTSFGKNKGYLRPNCKACWAAASRNYFARRERLGISKDIRTADERREKRAAFYLENKQRLINASLAYAKANSAKFAARAMQRLNALRSAIPSWADHECIQQYYERAAALTQTTGVKHQVDHIVPLQSKCVCGLHVESNLRVVTASVNIAKSNRYWPEMP